MHLSFGWSAAKAIVYGEDQGASQSDAGTSTFKEYILENTEEIIRFVNEELLDEKE